MPSLDFVTLEDLRSSLESDLQEMTRCAQAKAWKAVHVLAGSIVEAILIDALVSEQVVSLEQAVKLELAAAIITSKDKGIISARTADLSSVIRSYRNLIHPGRALRLSERVDAIQRTLAQALVSIVLEEMVAGGGSTMATLRSKSSRRLEGDSSASVICPRLGESADYGAVEGAGFRHHGIGSGGTPSFGSRRRGEI